MRKLELVGKKNNVIPIVNPATTCGCNKPAEYEVYNKGSKQGHCLTCMLDATDNEFAIQVRKIGGGGFDDAS